MIFYNIRKKLVKRNVFRYKIIWDKKSRSNLQFKVKQLLKPIWFADVVYEEFPVFSSLLKIDFLNATKRIAVEVQGPQHEKYNPFFHDHSPLKFVAGIKRDLKKQEWCEINNIKMIEVLESDLKDKIKFYSLIQS